MIQFEMKGAVITLWTVVCKDCGFESGLVEVLYPDKHRSQLTGAGCYQRRDISAAKQWAMEQIIGSSHVS